MSAQSMPGSTPEPPPVARLRTFDPAEDSSPQDRQEDCGGEVSGPEDARDAFVPDRHVRRVRQARDVLHAEASGIITVARRLDASFARAVEELIDCEGRCVVCGMGKAGLIGQKLAATLSSTGTPAHALHPGEAVHGDLGCVRAGDVVLLLSNSGETTEVTRLLATLRSRGARLIAITASAESTLGRESDVVLETGRLAEADAHGLAPSTSTTAMLALGDALALVTSQSRDFTPEQFAQFPPGGSLGRRLARAVDVMRPHTELRIAAESATVREVFISASRPGRRAGAVLLVDREGRLTGIFTDSDLARLLERREDDRVDGPIREVMTRQPLSVGPNVLVGEAVELLGGRKISELPVVDTEGRPVGLVDITDVIGMTASAASQERSQGADPAGRREAG